MNKNKISITLAALALLLGTGAGITSCTDEADNFDPARGNHTAGQLGIVSLSSDGVSLISDPARTASSRATNDDGTSAATANRAIRSFEAGDVVTTRYRFIDIATTPAPEASMHTCAATAEGLGTAASPLLWKMGKRDANTNPLAPGEDKNPAETWDEARMEITYAAIGTASATSTDPNYGTIVPPTGTDGDAALNRSHMAYHKSNTTIGDASAVVRQYFDALVASNLSIATTSLPGTKPATLNPGALYIERAKGKEQGAVSANLAHRGALMRLTADKTSISGFAEGFDCLTDLLARATIEEGAAGSATDKDIYVRFSSVTLTEGGAVWQAIVPAGAVVKQFIATIGIATKGEPTRAASTSTTPSATYYIPLTASTSAMVANTSYPLNLTLTPDVQTFDVGTAPALPGWPSDKEEEWVNTDAINVKDCTDAVNLTAKLTAAYNAGKTEWTVIGKAGDTWSDGSVISADSDITDAIKAALNAIGTATPTARISLSLSTMVTIADQAFEGCANLTTIKLPAATTIGIDAFASCVNLTTIKLPAATTIGIRAFNGCTALTTAILPEATKIDVNAFYVCTALTTAHLPKATTIIDAAFAGCAALTTIELPEATKIGNYAFKGCTALTTIDLPEAETIGENAFEGCAALTTAHLPEAMSIGNNAFSGCAALTIAHLPAATTIGTRAFSGCAALTTIKLPEATEIGENAFDCCTKLTTAILPKATTIITAAFASCTELTELSFGSIIITWGEDVLYGESGDFTSNITLTLAPEQKNFKQDGTGAVAPETPVEFGIGKSFAGYTFKEIKQAQ